MALQMEDALSGNVAEFGGFDGMESVLTCAKPVEHVVAGCVARVDGSALIPISAAGINRIDHGRLLFKPDEPYVYRVSVQEARITLRRGHPSGEQIRIEKVWSHALGGRA
jgi:hypothetical protein